MRGLQDIVDRLPRLKPAMSMACRWLTDVAQVKTDGLAPEENTFGLQHTTWAGSFRGEYSANNRRWNMYAPTWHGGQAIKALAQAHQIDPDPAYLHSAEACASFILAHRVISGPDAGFIRAYEEIPNQVYVSSLLETLDGLLVLGQIGGDKRYIESAVDAANWCRQHAWIAGQGLVLDLYDPKTRTFVEKPCVTKDNAPGRPLADDAIFLKAWQLTGDEAYRTVFYEIMHRLLKDENPAGNWVDYGPCRPDKGECHPRHAYWWGYPMLDAFADSGDERWLAAARRAGQWYVKAQRNDGGLFRYTDHQFKTDSFGHATSGIACAAILWTKLFEITGETEWLTPIHKALNYSIDMQFTKPSDENLKGCILEKVNPPDGTDRSPYYIRDLGTIFFIQAAAQVLMASEPKGVKVTLAKPRSRKGTLLATP